MDTERTLADVLIEAGSAPRGTSLLTPTQIACMTRGTKLAMREKHSGAAHHVEEYRCRGQNLKAGRMTTCKCKGGAPCSFSAG